MAMEQYAGDFGFFIPSCLPLMNVEYPLSEFPAFQDLPYLCNDFPQHNQQALTLEAQNEQREVSAPVQNKRMSESRYWTKEENERFNYALKLFGIDFEAIARYVGTRNSTQVRTHAQKYYAKMVRDYKKNGKPSQSQAKSQKTGEA